MKPRHQLTRTPPNSKKHEKPALEALEVKNAIQPPFQLYSEPTQEVEIISPKIQGILMFLIKLMKNCIVYEIILFTQI